MLFVCAPTIRNCHIINNLANMCGGGISVFCPGDFVFPSTGPLIFGNEIINNTVSEATGGGVDVYFRANAEIVNNLFVGNRAWGGAIAVLDDAQATIDCNTIVGNRGSVPGLAMTLTATVTMTNTIFASNLDGLTLELPGTIAYSHCSFWDNEVPWEPPPGQGHITADPLFVTGPRGDYYLSQTAAGQPATSPCVDAGSGPASESAVGDRTTRTDEVTDAGVVDIGYHYRPWASGVAPALAA